MDRAEAAKIRRHGSLDLARDGVHRFNAARPDGLFDNRTDGPTQTETSYDDLHRACRRRDPGCVDPLRHVFEDAMSCVSSSPPHSIFDAAVLRNRNSGVTAIGIRAQPDSKSPDGVVFFIRAGEIKRSARSTGRLTRGKPSPCRPVAENQDFSMINR
jgi:hypothetical protein